MQAGAKTIAVIHKFSNSKIISINIVIDNPEPNIIKSNGVNKLNINIDFLELAGIK